MKPTKKKLKKPIKIPCDCLGNEKYCGYLQIVDYEDGDCEIQVWNYKGKANTIYLSTKSIKKVIKYLSKLI
jgi:hypothetical protein